MSSPIDKKMKALSVKRTNNIYAMKDSGFMQLPRDLKGFLTNFSCSMNELGLSLIIKDGKEILIHDVFPSKYYLISDIINLYKDRIEPDLIPIMSVDGGGDLILVNSASEYFFWKHDCNEEKGTVKISHNLTDFVSLLSLTKYSGADVSDLVVNDNEHDDNYWEKFKNGKL